MKILAANDKIRCMRCHRLSSYHNNRSLSTKALIFLLHAKEMSETSLRTNTVFNF